MIKLPKIIYVIALVSLGIAVLTNIVLHVNLKTKKNLNKIEQTLLSFVYVVYTGFTGLVVFQMLVAERGGKKQKEQTGMNYVSAIQTVFLLWAFVCCTFFWIYLYMNFMGYTNPETLKPYRFSFVMCFLIFEVLLSICFLLGYIFKSNLKGPEEHNAWKIFIIVSLCINGIIFNTVYDVLNKMKLAGESDEAFASSSGFINYVQYVYWVNIITSIYFIVA